MKFLILIIALFLTCYSLAFGQDNRMINYTVENGLINNTVYYSMQDSKGFMWFCTESGVSRFDGTNWDNFTLDNGLADNENFKCFEDSKNRIWFLSSNGKFCYYLNGKIYQVSLTKSDIKLEVGMLFDCIEDKKTKQIFFLSNLRKLFHFDEKKREIKFDGANCFILADYKNETFSFFGEGPMMDLKASSLANKHLKESIIPSKGEHKSYYYINNPIPVVGKNNRIFYLTNLGVFQIYQGKISSFLPLENFPKIKSIILLYKFNNDIYFGGSGGIYKVENAFNAKKIFPKLVFSDLQANNLFIDKLGNKWVSTHNKGVYFFPKNQANAKNIELFYKNEPLETYSISTFSKNKLTVGIFKNSVAELDRNNNLYYRNLNADKSKKFNRIKSIVYKGANTYYISDNFFLVEKTKTSKTIFCNQNYFNTLKNYCFDSEGDIWLIASNFIQKYDVKKNQITDYISISKRGSSIACGEDNCLFIGTKQGLFKFKNHSFSSLNNLSPFFKEGINHLIYTNKELWISTHGKGVIVLKNNKVIKVLNKENGLTNNVCYRIVESKDYIFICSSIGLSIVNRKNFEITNLTVSDGLISNDVKDVAIDENEKLYIATNKGISILSWQQIQKSVDPPTPYLRAFQVNDSIFNNNQKAFEYPFTPGLLSLQFAAITYYSPGFISYRYRIKGEKNWQTNTSGNISFYNLAPGNYSIELQAKQYKSTWSKPIFTSFNILPLWYQTSTFKIMAISLMLLSLTAAIYWRIRWIRNRDKVKHLIEIRMNELERRTLAAQMNPHFIFNSLNTLQQLVLDEETETALNYLNDFAVLVRQILSNSRKPAITITEEITFLKNYLLVEKVRFNDAFSFEIDVQSDLDEMIAIPPMLIQPIVENAIKYGVSTATLDLPKINIKIWQETHLLNFQITDNGAGFEKVKSLQQKNELTKSNALEILTERLALIFVHNKRGSMTLTSFDESDKQGTQVHIQIPI